ncbi:MAG: hypothetical protein JSW63_01110 [Ignavibacterium sp.]|nr:MAG: hypothetical protein JSW63_01110 [Ignavibacterium sp.]
MEEKDNQKQQNNSVTQIEPEAKVKTNLNLMTGYALFVIKNYFGYI